MPQVSQFCGYSASEKYQVHIWQAGALGYAGTVLVSGVIAELTIEYLHFHAAIVCAIMVTICGKTVADRENQINESQIAIFLIMIGLLILSVVFSIFFFRDLIKAAQYSIYSGYQIQAAVPHQFGMEAPRLQETLGQLQLSAYFVWLFMALA